MTQGKKYGWKQAEGRRFFYCDSGEMVLKYIRICIRGSAAKYLVVSIWYFVTTQNITPEPFKAGCLRFGAATHQL